MKKRRIASIDVFRALTMFLMVFVNDLWTDSAIPAWLEHASRHADGMGFADIIFPAFLFLVGLSLPFAQENRVARGIPRLTVFRHIVLRSIALIVMGFFQMNLEHYSPQAALPEAVWEILITVAFFLIWLDYPKDKSQGKKSWLQLSGIVLLVIMALLYKGQTRGITTWMHPYWWGILGLIGWAYFSCATILLFGGERLIILIIAFVFFVFFNSSVRSGWPGFFEPVRHWVAAIGLGDASNASITMDGVVIAVLYRKFMKKPIQLGYILIIFAAVLFAFGFGTRPWWGISKIRATPSWTMICSAISILVFLLLIFIIDRKGKQDWFKIIKPAGTSTLTCYLLPYFHEAIFISLIGIQLPLLLRTGRMGIVKSLIFALLIVLVTGWMEKKRLRLKI